MFVPLTNVNQFLIRIDQSNSSKMRPGKYLLQVREDEIIIKRAFMPLVTIPYSHFVEFGVTYSMQSKLLSPSKAVVGAVVAGPVGAVVGAAMGGKKTEATCSIHYIDEDMDRTQLSFSCSEAGRLENKINAWRQNQ